LKRALFTPMRPKRQDALNHVLREMDELSKEGEALLRDERKYANCESGANDLAEQMEGVRTLWVLDLALG
jgi:hypothetical protein